MAKRNAFTPVGLYPKINLPWTEMDVPHLRPETDGEVDADKLEENFRALKMQIDDQSRYLNRTDFSNSEGTRWATYVIAAFNSTDLSKRTADFVCSGSNDQTVINQVINLMYRSSTAPMGRIVFLEGTYNLSDEIVANALTARTLIFQGMGPGGHESSIGGTRIVQTSGSKAVFNVGGNSASAGSTIVIQDLQMVSTSSVACIYNRDMPTIVHNCSINAGGTGGAINQTNSTGTGAGSQYTNNYIYCTGSGGNGIVADVGAGLDRSISIANNFIKITAGGVGIQCGNSSSTVPTYIVDGNCIIGSTTASGTGIKLTGNSIENCAVTGNVVKNVNIGIECAGYRHTISGNVVDTVVTGITTGPDSQYLAILANLVNSATTGFVLANSAVSPTIIGNKGSNLTTAYTVGSGVTNATVAYNDFGTATGTDAGTGTKNEGSFLTAAMLPLHSTRHESGGADAITGNLDANARVAVRKNSAGAGSKRRRINLIEGSNVTLTVADDSGDEEVDVTIAASSGGGTLTVKANGSTIGAQSTLNVVGGTGITVSATDTGTQIDVTISAGAAAASVAANEYNYFSHR